MLKLIANGSPLELSDVSFNLTRRSYINGDKGGSFVFSVTIPYSSANARSFGFPFEMNRVQVLHASVEGRIEYNGMHVQDGTWNVKSANSKTIELEMVIGAGHFNSLVDGHNVPEYITKTRDIYPDLPAWIESRIEMVYPETEIQFPSVLNSKFYGDEVNPEFSGIINYYSDGISDKPANHTCIVPMAFLLWVVESIFKNNGYTPSGIPFTDPYLKTALLYNNYALDDVIGVHFHGEKHMSILASPFQVIWDVNIVDPLTGYNNTTGQYRVDIPGAYQINCLVNTRIDVPENGYKQITVVLKYGSTIVDSWIEDIYTLPHPHWVYTNIILNHTVLEADTGNFFTVTMAYLDASQNPVQTWIEHFITDIVNTTTPELNTYGHHIEHKNHVPNMSVKDFLNEFYIAYKIIPFFNHEKKTVVLHFMSDILAKRKSMPLDGLIKDSLTVYKNVYEGLTFGFDFQGPDDLLKNNFQVPESYIEVDTWDEMPTVNSLGNTVYVSSLNAFFEWVFFSSEEAEQNGSRFDPGTTTEDGVFGWLCIGDLHTDQIIDGGKDSIRTGLAPMLMRYNEYDGMGRNLPSIEAAGTSTRFSLNNEFPLRVMYYSGLTDPLKIIDTIEDCKYPLATTTNSDTHGNIVQPIYYRMDQIITRYWHQVILWYKRRLKVEFTNLVTPQFISSLDMKKKFELKNSLIYVEEIVVKIKNKLFGPGDFSGWTS